MRIRRAERSDVPILEAMLVEAVNWDPAKPPLVLTEIRQDDRLLRYVDGWPREGDAGVIAEEGGRAVGAAWFRRYPRRRPGFGFIDEATPEVSIAVAPRWRCQGIGTALLLALMAIGRERDGTALSLSVEAGNPAIRLYRRLGFSVEAEEPGATTMRIELCSAREFRSRAQF